MRHSLLLLVSMLFVAACTSNASGGDDVADTSDNGALHVTTSALITRSVTLTAESPSYTFDYDCDGASGCQFYFATEFSQDTLANALLQAQEAEEYGLEQVIVNVNFDAPCVDGGYCNTFDQGYLYFDDGAHSQLNQSVGGSMAMGHHHTVIARGRLVDDANSVEFTLKFASEATDPTWEVAPNLAF